MSSWKEKVNEWWSTNRVELLETKSLVEIDSMKYQYKGCLIEGKNDSYRYWGVKVDGERSILRRFKRLRDAIYYLYTQK